MCKDTIDLVTRLAGPGNHVQLRDMHQPDTAERARTLGIRSLPAVVIDGRLAACCAGRGPSEHVLREYFRVGLAHALLLDGRDGPPAPGGRRAGGAACKGL
jgi:glutaredoxin 3